MTQRRPETAGDMDAYLAQRGETRESHTHQWFAWDAWESWNWAPHSGASRLLVCDVPDCVAVKTERKE